jgi:2-C-methyl-D-erythritol 4-phosphate cytidylyltransferase
LPRDVGVIIVAAGKGERMGGPPKQFRNVAGVPMLLRAIRPFVAHPDVAHVAVVVAPDVAAAPPAWLGELRGGTLSVTVGGSERRQSVAAGLAALPDECNIVLVHDAARPFVDPAVIDGIIAEARAGRSAIAAVPMSDTIKEAASDGRTVVRTVPRDALWRAQTPQGFPRAVLAAAHAAGEPSLRATDDASLVEAAGGTVTLVPDSATNFKITSAADLALADAWARSGAEAHR